MPSLKKEESDSEYIYISTDFDTNYLAESEEEEVPKKEATKIVDPVIRNKKGQVLRKIYMHSKAFPTKKTIIISNFRRPSSTVGIKRSPSNGNKNAGSAEDAKGLPPATVSVESASGDENAASAADVNDGAYNSDVKKVKKIQFADKPEIKTIKNVKFSDDSE